MNIRSADVAGKRPYRQQARAEASSRTRDAILDAMVSLGMKRATTDVSLADVAAGAGVSVQTVLRHFGSREGLLEASLRHGAERFAAERRPVASDLPTAITALFDHYEARGDGVIRLLAQEAFDTRIAQITAQGRRVHRQWVTDFLAASREGAAAATEALIDQLVVVTDVYTWKLLRRDRGLPRAAAEDRVREMVEAMLRMARSGREKSS
jgi:AcrR family transcriptional regulator